MKKMITMLVASLAATAINAQENMDNQYLITVEEHFTDQRIIDANGVYLSQQPKPTGKLAEAMEFFQAQRLIGQDLLDINERRLPHMDELGIKMQILSYTAPVGDYVPAEEAVRICKEANDILAARVAEHPDRFRAMATLPMADPEAAAAELERCVKKLGFVGVLLTGTWQRHFYDEERFFPIFAKAAELDVPVYWHPDFVAGDIIDYYYMSDSYSATLGAKFSSAGFGWHLDVGIHVTRMVLSGIFDKLPNLKFVMGHWGEDIPAFLDRLDYMLDPKTTGLKRQVSQYFKDNIWYTPSGIMSEMQFDYFVRLVGAEHIIWSEDYPYIKNVPLRFFLDTYAITDEQKELIAHGNAERLFKLK